jgi:deoxyribose-phosphate aldolase
MELNQYIDHTLLSAAATETNILKLCKALKHNFYSVCINSGYVCHLQDKRYVNLMLEFCTVVGFPLGAMSTRLKYMRLKGC